MNYIFNAEHVKDTQSSQIEMILSAIAPTALANLQDAN